MRITRHGHWASQEPTRSRLVELRSGGNVASPAPPAHRLTARTSRPLSRKESEMTPKAGTNPSFPLARAKDFGSQGRPQKWTRKTLPSKRREFKETLLSSRHWPALLTLGRHRVVQLRKRVLPGILPGRPHPPPRCRARGASRRRASPTPRPGAAGQALTVRAPPGDRGPLGRYGLLRSGIIRNG